MFIFKIYAFIALLIYIFLGLYFFKKNQLDPITLLALIIVSIFWFPFCIYAILEREK